MKPGKRMPLKPRVVRTGLCSPSALHAPYRADEPTIIIIQYRQRLAVFFLRAPGSLGMAAGGI
jgi:hypothetical protein